MHVLGLYKNGNYNVAILSDGTKIRQSDEDKLLPEFPENIDLKISNKCDLNCKMCHEGSTPDGENGDIMNMDFIDTLMPYTEMAIGGGNPLANPQLIPFLCKLKEKKIIANLTVNQIHFMQDLKFLKMLADKELIYGLGVSLVDPTDEFIAAVQQFPNAVIHVINGIVSMDDLEKLADKRLKVLVLGYKTLRRGAAYRASNQMEISTKKSQLYDALENLLPRFKVFSLDNLAIHQLHPERFMDEKEWKEFYMGDDGSHTMYIDAVKKEFAVSSVSPYRYPLEDDIKSMFKKVREESVSTK